MLFSTCHARGKSSSSSALFVSSSSLCFHQHSAFLALFVRYSRPSLVVAVAKRQPRKAHASFQCPHLEMATNMSSDTKHKHHESAKPSTIIQLPGQMKPDSHGARRPSRRRKPNVTALLIIAIALALLLAAVIVIGTTRLNNSTNNTPSENTTATTTPSPSPSPTSAEPSGGDQGLSWCQTQDDGNCTLGVYQNLDSGQTRAQVFDHTCSLPLVFSCFSKSPFRSDV